MAGTTPLIPSPLSCPLESYAVPRVVWAAFDDFEDFFPLDDLDGIFLFVEELGDEGAAEAVAFVS